MLNKAIWHEKYHRWQINVTINGKRKSFYSSKPGRLGRHECEEKAEKWSDVGASKDAKVKAVWEEFLEHYERLGQEETYIKAEIVGRLYVDPVIGNLKLSSIRPQHWQRIIDQQHDRGLAKNTLIGIRGACKTFSRWARKQEYMCCDVDVDIPSDAHVGKKRVATARQLRELFEIDTVEKNTHPTRYAWARENPDFEWYIYAYRFIVINGLRRGELAGIREDDIEGDVLYIRRSINAHGKETGGKTRNASRTIGLSSIAKKLIEQQRALKRRAGYITPWLFCDMDGERMDANALYREWRRYYAPQLCIDCTLHELRHTFISAVKSDLPLALLKEMVGHSEDTDSIGIYGHNFDGDLKRTADICDNVFKRFVSSY